MSIAWERFGTVLRQFLTPLMDRRSRNPQFASNVRNRLAAGLSQAHRFSLKLWCIGLLHFLHDPVLLLKEYTLSFHSSTNSGQDQDTTTLDFGDRTMSEALIQDRTHCT